VHLGAKVGSILCIVVGNRDCNCVGSVVELGILDRDGKFVGLAL